MKYFHFEGDSVLRWFDLEGFLSLGISVLGVFHSTGKVKGVMTEGFGFPFFVHMLYVSVYSPLLA